MFHTFITTLLFTTLLNTGCKTTSTVESNSGLSNIDFGDIKNSDGTLIKYEKLRMSIYGSDSDEEPLQEKVYTFKDKTISDDKMSVERGGTYYMYLQYYTTTEVSSTERPTVTDDGVEKEQSNDLGTLLYENCNKKRKKFVADKATVTLSIDLCKPKSVNTGDDEIIVTNPDNNEIPEKTQNGDSITTIKARETTYWTAGYVPTVEGDDLGEKENVVDTLSCAYYCESNDQCNAFSYRNSTESCYLKNVKFADTLNFNGTAKDQGWQFYWSETVKEGKVIDFQ